MTSRGNERREIVCDDEDRRRFVRILGDTVIRARWILHAWVLMSNHYHLLVETPEPTLSKGAKRLNQSYAEAFNERHERVGHLFQGRFKGILVERESHLLELVRYIVLNPVRAHCVRIAGDYEWSNYHATAGLRAAPSWLEIAWTLKQFQPVDIAAAHEAYRRFVADGRGASYNPWEQVLGQIYLGGTEFRERMQDLVDSKKRSREHPVPQRTFNSNDMDSIAAHVGSAFGIAPEHLRRKSRHAARKALAKVAVEDLGLSLRAVGTWLGVSEAAVSKMCSAATRLCRSDEPYRSTLASIRASLS